MNCKFCSAELAEGVTLCPVCGKENEETRPVEEAQPVEETQPVEEAQPAAEMQPVGEAQPEDEALPEPAAQEKALRQKGMVWKAILAVLCGAALLAVLSFVVLKNLGIDPLPPKNDIHRKASYTSQSPEKTASRTVAQIGDAKLTNSLLQVFYWSEVHDFVDYFGDYTLSVGLDVTSQLNYQTCSMDETMTWQQYFLQYALETWQRYQVLCLLAEETGLELDAGVAEALELLPDEIDALALEYGFANGDALVQDKYGPGTTVADYVEYMRMYYYALQYFNLEYTSINPTLAELDAYYHENLESFVQSGVTQDSGIWVDARHIFLMPKGGTTDDSGNLTYSEEEWEACRVEAQAILDEWLAGEATEESFAELANKYSKDPGSNTNGGLYTQWKPTDNLFAAYKEWIFDESRQPGDYGLVRSESGYHIMYYVKGEEGWIATARSGLMADRADKIIEDAIARWPMKVTYKKIALGESSFYDVEDYAGGFADIG